MIMRAQRGRGLGQDDPFTNALNVAQTPVTLQVSPLLLGNDMYLQAAGRRTRDSRARLGDIPAGAGLVVGLVNPVAGMILTANDAYATSIAPATGCSYLDFFVNSARWQACQMQREIAQIQTVPQNAAAAGYPTPVVQVAQDTADQQSADAAGDSSNVASYYGAGQVLYDPQNQTALPTWLWVLLAGGIGVVAYKLLK